jgi:hypothetical protein
MKKHRLAKLFLEELAKVPNVQMVCDKIGISRNTVYRWKEEDADFSSMFEKALQESTSVVNDIAEGHLLKKINNGDFKPITFWLKHRHPEYKNKSNIHIEKYSEVSQETIDSAMKTFFDFARQEYENNQ